MPVSNTAWVTALLFGAMLGWALGRDGADRRTVVGAALITATVGAGIWLSGPATGSDAAMASVSMTLGGLTSAAATLITGSRQVT